MLKRIKINDTFTAVITKRETNSAFDELKYILYKSCLPIRYMMFYKEGKPISSEDLLSALNKIAETPRTNEEVQRDFANVKKLKNRK